MTKEPKILGGIGEVNFGKQYRPGNRVYDSGACAMAICAQPVGNMGGYSYLYLIKKRENVINGEQNYSDRLTESDKGMSGQSEGVFFYGNLPSDKSNGLQRPTKDFKKAILIGNFLSENYGTSFAGNVYDKYGLCPTLRSSEGGHKQPFVIESVKNEM